MSNNVHLDVHEAKKYVGRGFSTSRIKTTKNKYGKSLGYSLSDLDAFIAKRDVRENERGSKKGMITIGFHCSISEYEEIKSFTRFHGMGYRELVLRSIRKSNESPSFLKFLKED